MAALKRRKGESWEAFGAREHLWYFTEPPLPWGRRARTGTWHLYIGQRRRPPQVGSWQSSCSIGHASREDAITWSNLPDPETRQVCRRCLASWTLKRRCSIEGSRIVMKGTPKAADKQERLASLIFAEAVRAAGKSEPDAIWERFTATLQEVGLRIVLVDEGGQP